MNKKQQKFVNEMLRHGDKQQAYRTAYPDAQSDKAIESSVNRLLKHPEVKQAIDEPTTRLKAEAKAEVEAELKERMKAELLSFHEAQVTLTNIIRGTHTTEKWVKEKDGWKTIEVKPTQSNIISALNTFFRLNNHYPQKKTAAQLKAEEQEYKAATKKKWEPDPELKAIMKMAADNPYRHPFGDIYPPEYPGPWFDPDDPNTREQFLAITEPYRLSKIAQENSQQNTTISIPVPSLRGTKQSSPNTSKSNAGLDCFVAKPPRNDVNLESAQQNTTKHYNKESSFPVLREGGPQDRKGNTQHEQKNTTEHNKTQQPEPDLEEQIATKYKHVSTKVRQSLLTDALRKQGWQTIEDAFNMAHDMYIHSQHSGTIKMMQLFEKAKNARNYPPHLREPIEKETGWTFHPKYPNMMRRTRALGW